MIDWYNVAANALWIFACAGALAVISAALFHSRSIRTSLRTTLQQSPYPLLLDLAGSFFCLGQAAVVFYEAIWKAGLWLALALMFFLMVIFIKTTKR
jgi:hypothetical protein